jgi:shikimate dehydrogenase
MTEVFEWRDAPAADFAVIGDPVRHSRSPAMHNAAYRALGLPYRYVAIEVPSGEVLPALDHLSSLGYVGVNVTVPHKSEVIGWCDSSDSFVVRVGAANTVSLASHSCINTDAPGFMETLPHFCKNVLVLGAGGSARALVAVLSDAQCNLSVFNRTTSRARSVIKDLGIEATFQAEPDLTGADLVLNTTSGSLSGETLNLNWSAAKPGALAYDLVYGETPFLRAAASAGLATMDGIALLVAQGARSFEWWLDVPAPRDVMMEAARCES